jgi:hypothetical protein
MKKWTVAVCTAMLLGWWILPAVADAAKKGAAGGGGGMHGGGSKHRGGGRHGSGDNAGGGGAGGGSAVTSPDDVRATQQILLEQGLFPGSVDGVMGPETVAALRAFQGSAGLPETGFLDSDTRARLGLDTRRQATVPSAPQK